MRSPREQMVIMIELTNACQYTCSNCTRLCGNHKKPFFMDFETFKRAVDSMKDFDGVVGIIGGEPLLHPDFSHYMDYLKSNSNFIAESQYMQGFSPMPKDYIKCAHIKHWAEMAAGKGGSLCLFTSIPKQYYKYYEVINDVFGYQRLNDHSYPSFHQPILVSRKDLNISDEQFLPLRDNCWIQNTWSSSVTPKGAFFCEVAAHLDMLFDGPGGWPIESGWWKRRPEDFGAQLNYCELCGVALQTFSRDANEGVYDVSPSLYEKLKGIASPLLKKNKINLLETKDVDHIDEKGVVNLLKREFQPDYGKRMGKSSDYLMPKNLVGAILIDEKYTYQRINKIVECTAKELDKIIVCADMSNLSEEDIDLLKSKCILIELDNAEYSFGGKINKLLAYIEEYDWLIFVDEYSVLCDGFKEKIKARYLNPGGVYIFESGVTLINKMAGSIQRAGFDGIKSITSIKDLINIWEQSKKFNVDFSIFEGEDVDIVKVREQVFKFSYEDDNIFITDLKVELEKSTSGSNKVLVMQTGMIFHTTSVVKLLIAMGYDVFVLMSKKFVEYFIEIIPDKNLICFDSSHFNFNFLRYKLDELKSNHEFRKVFLPVTIKADEMKLVDDYHEPLKVANYITADFKVINISRKIIPIEESLRVMLNLYKNEC